MTDPVPALMAVALVLGMSATAPHPRYGIVGSLPLAAVGLVAGATAIGVFSGLAGWSLLNRPGVTWLLLAFVVAAVLWRRRISMHERMPRSGVAGWAGAGGLVMLGVAAALSVAPVERRLNWFLDADNVRHVVFLADVWSAGDLSYRDETYPRGWHATQSLMWSAGRAGLQPDRITGLLSTSALMTWLAFAVLCFSAGLISASLSRALGVGEGGAKAAALLSGSAPLWLSFSGVYLANGYQTSVVAALSLLAAAHEATSGTSRQRQVLASTAAFVVVAHSWQILVPIAGGLFLLAVTKRPEHSERRGLMLLPVLACAVAAPAVLAVVSRVGISHAADADVVAQIPYFWLLTGTAGAITSLTVRRVRNSETVVVSALVLGSVGLGLGLAAVLAIPPTKYYPSKTLWQAALLGIPLVCALVAYAGGLLLRRAGVSQGAASRGSAVLITLVVLPWVLFPLTALFGLWSAVDSATVLRALTSPGAPSADVVWTDDREDDTIARILLDIYRVSATRDRTIQHPALVSELCQLLEDDPDPTVLSDQPNDVVRSRFDCVAGLRVVRITG